MLRSSKTASLQSYFNQFPELLAFTTTRNAFGEKEPLFPANDPQGTDLRKNLSALLGISSACLVIPFQTHSSNIAVLDKLPESDLPDTDAMITGKSGICLCIQTADCVPVILYDPLKSVIAAIHAGWRGTYRHIVKNTIQAMKNHFASDPQNIYATIGPAIGYPRYETGDEVAELFLEEFRHPEKFLRKQNNGRWHLDLWEANTLELLEAGLPQTGIHQTGHCTYQMGDLYYSVRREGPDTGRMVTGIMLHALRGFAPAHQGSQ